MTSQQKWMHLAFELAQQAEAQGEVPVGAIIVREDRIIGQGYNQPITTHDPSAHAEIVALRQAGEAANNYRLPDSTMYVTLEPCAMCAGALIQARLSKLVYAVDDSKTGACGSVFNLLQTQALNHKVRIEKGIMENECRALIQNFFKHKRRKQKISHV